MRQFRTLSGHARREAGSWRRYEIDGLRVRVGEFPVSIETAIYSRMARNAARSPLAKRVRDSLGGCRLILGVDRLDYSKGIPQRKAAFLKTIRTGIQE